MNLLKILFKLAVFAVVAVAALTIVGKVRQRSAAGNSSRAAADKPSDAGFILLRPEDAKNPRVAIMSPPNCPSDAAQRARALDSALNSAGIPCEIKSGISFSFDNPDDAARVQKFMANVADPLVLVRGWAKGNPTVDQVIAEYRTGSGK